MISREQMHSVLTSDLQRDLLERILAHHYGYEHTPDSFTLGAAMFFVRHVSRNAASRLPALGGYPWNPHENE
ncbi:hypothetical protein RA29_11430 [Tateyamaria sp. ANG-S1]|nr:hypothetical protein RA29_11430 [Tateyamaria sp. ANG-S1]